MTEVLTAATDPRLLKGRGARSNGSSRYDSDRRLGFDDGWNSDDEEPAPIKTEVMRDATWTIIARNTSPDIPFDQSINPYRGCEHGCIYCFARPTHAYLGLSPGIDFESKILVVKPDAAQIARSGAEKSHPAAAIDRHGDEHRSLSAGLSANKATDALHSFKCSPSSKIRVGIVTKSALIARDIDILRRWRQRVRAKVALIGHHT